MQFQCDILQEIFSENAVTIYEQTGAMNLYDHLPYSALIAHEDYKTLNTLFQTMIDIFKSEIRDVADQLSLTGDIIQTSLFEFAKRAAEEIFEKYITEAIEYGLPESVEALTSYRPQGAPEFTITACTPRLL